MTGGYVMRIVHVTGIVSRPDTGARVGQYVASYDPEAYDGLGDVASTTDLAEAHIFATTAEAMLAWRAVPACRPVRADGQPNRPLTCFSVEMLSVEQARVQPGWLHRELTL